MKLGIALSGGGTKGIAHAGVLKALEENGIHIDIIGGSSSGSLVSALYALGFSPYYIYVLLKRYTRQVTQMESKPILSGIGGFMTSKKIIISGFKTGDLIESAYNEIALKRGVKKIGDLRMPLVIPAVDIYSAKKYLFVSKKPETAREEQNEYITDISLGKAVRASSSFPAIFMPCIYKEYAFLDGGMLDNTPVSEIKKLGANKVIAVEFESEEVNEYSNVMDIVMKSVDIMSRKLAENNFKMANYKITIPSEKMGILDAENLDFLYKVGYNATLKNMEEIKKAIGM